MTAPGGADPRWPDDDEPRFEAAATIPVEELARRVEATPARGGRVVVAVDGRSAGGKTTFSARLTDGRDGWSVVHTDDVAWHHSFFDWADLLATGVLAPAVADGGEPVAFRPPAWDERDRPGAVEVPAGTRVLVVEGVGASRAELAPWIDVACWVHTPFDVVLRREDDRIAAGESDADLSRDWLSAEAAFLAADRPWSRADVVVAGSPVAAGPAADEGRVTVLLDPADVDRRLAATAAADR